MSLLFYLRNIYSPETADRGRRVFGRLPSIITFAASSANYLDSDVALLQTLYAAQYGYFNIICNYFRIFAVMWLSLNYF